MGQGDQGALTAPEIIGQDRPTLTEERVREIICEEVVEIVRGQIPEMFGSIKTAMMEYFDEKYAALAETAATAATTDVTVAGGGAGRAFQYGTSITRSPRHLMVHKIRKNPCGGCFFTCSCSTDQKA